MFNRAESTTTIASHALYKRLILGSCAILLALVSCRGPVGSQGDAGIDVIRVSGWIDNDGYGRFTIFENEDNPWPEGMPLVHFWVRETSRDRYYPLLLYTTTLVDVKPDSMPMREIDITFVVSSYQYGGYQYLALIVFYEETEIISPASLGEHNCVQ